MSQNEQSTPRAPRHPRIGTGRSLQEARNEQAAAAMAADTSGLGLAPHEEGLPREDVIAAREAEKESLLATLASRIAAPDKPIALDPEHRVADPPVQVEEPVAGLDALLARLSGVDIGRIGGLDAKATSILSEDKQRTRAAAREVVAPKIAAVRAGLARYAKVKAAASPLVTKLKVLDWAHVLKQVRGLPSSSPALGISDYIGLLKRNVDELASVFAVSEWTELKQTLGAVEAIIDAEARDAHTTLGYLDVYGQRMLNSVESVVRMVANVERLLARVNDELARTGVTLHDIAPEPEPEYLAPTMTTREAPGNWKQERAADYDPRTYKIGQQPRDQQDGPPAVPLHGGGIRIGTLPRPGSVITKPVATSTPWTPEGA